MRFFHPQIHLFASDKGTSGYCATSEPPVFYYSVAGLYKLFGVHEFMILLINLLIFLAGVYYFYRLLLLLLKNQFWSFGFALLLFTSPVLVYYADNYLTNASALALGIIGFYHSYAFSENKRISFLYYSALFYLLAACFKITALFMVFAILGYYVYERMGQPAGNRNRLKIFYGGMVQVLPFAAVVLLISGWVLYARHYNALHDSTHFSTTIFPIWNYDLRGIRGIPEGIGKYWLSSYFNIYTLMFIGLLAVSIPLNYRHINSTLIILLLLLLPVVILFILVEDPTGWRKNQIDFFVPKTDRSPDPCNRLHFPWDFIPTSIDAASVSREADLPRMILPFPPILVPG